MADTVPLSEEQRRLVQENAPLAKFLARKRWEMNPNKLEYEELVSLAYQGLMDASIRWRPYSEERGLAEEEIVAGKGFSVFSRTRIIGSILDWQKRDADHVPRSYRTDFKILQRAGYPDTVRKYAELSEITGISLERITLVVAAVERTPFSLDEDWDANEPASPQNVEQSVLVRVVGAAVSDRVATLPELQQTILALRYFVGLELQAIAEELNTNMANVREAHNAAIEAVRDAMLTAVTV
jgi:RNA polymerase sigma factor (sigma-70 family)